MATLDELVVSIKADASQLERELKRVQGVTQQQTSKMTGAFANLRAELERLAPALGVAGLVAFGRQAFREADHINDLALRTGFLGSTLSALNIPLRQSGSNLDEFASALSILNNQIGEAAKGNQEAVKAFDQLGLSVTELLKLSPEERFFAVAQALGEVEDQARRTESGRNLLGRGFATMNPLIEETKGNIKGLADEIKRSGDALTDEQLQRIDELGDRWEAALGKIKLELLNVMPLVEGLANVPAYLRAALIDIPHVAGQNIGLLMQGIDPRDVRTLPTVEVTAKKEATRNAKGSNAGLIRNTELESALRAYRDYIAAIEQENYLLHINEKEQAGVKAMLEAENLARKAHIDISDEDREKIMGLASANAALKDSMQEAARFSQELKDKLSGGLAQIALSFDSATDSARRFAEQLAQTILERKVTGPFADAFIDMIDESDIGSGIRGMLGFASGGRPPVGRPSWVGEKGPEIFVPDSAGTVIPNHAIGGGGMNVVNNWYIQSGVTRQELAALVPVIEARTKNSILEGVQRGGPEARIFGRRN